MKKILLTSLFFIFALSSWGAVSHTVQLCPWTGLLYEVCPAELTDAASGDSLTSTSSNIRVTDSLSTGTLYWGVSLSATPPSESNLMDGTGMEDFANDPTPIAGVNIFGASGLISKTTYFPYFLDISVEDTSSTIVASPSFTTLSGGGGGALEGFFVDDVAGSDSNNGTSDAEAWETVAKVNSTVATEGADVWFKEGGRWSERLIIDWGGTVGDRALVGTYHMDMGVETRGLSSDTDPGDPDTDPSTWQGAILEQDFPISYDSAFKNLALVDIQSAFVTVENINVYKSNGRGIAVDKQSGGEALIDNVLGDESAMSNFIIARLNPSVGGGGGSAEIKDSEFTLGASCFDVGGTGPTGCDGQWPGCIAIIATDDVNFHDNILSDCFGEGIGMFNRVNGTQIVDNLITEIRQPAIYMNGVQDTFVEGNRVYGELGAFDGDIALAYENGVFALNASGNLVQNNLISGTFNCFSLFMQSGPIADASALLGWDVEGNTCAGVSRFINVSLGATDANNNLTPGVTYTDNLFFDHITGAADNCNMPNSSNITLSRNLTDEPWDDNDCDGTNDQENKISATLRTDWTTSEIDLPPFSDACLNPTSDGIENGTPGPLIPTYANGVARSASVPNIGSMDNCP